MPLRQILLVEDDALDAQLSARALEPVRAAFPNAVIETVSSLELALDIVRTQIPPPVLAIIDLGLPDMDRTLQYLHEFQERCPIVIHTGRQPEEVRDLIGFPVEIINKDQAQKNPSILHAAISRAYAVFHNQGYAQQWKTIEALKEIAKERSNGSE